MPDDPKTDLTGPISLATYRAIKDWCAYFGCTEVELAEAIAVVGHDPHQVRAFLQNRLLW
ncbi:MAG TPA: DUF3606 domain-containing protein [Caldimonas sp.]|nr:DUF3606 domain-containing protein [Caldimonas sp.]